jgi:hypothetical protein
MGIVIEEGKRGIGFAAVRNGKDGEEIKGVIGFTINSPKPGEPVTVTLTAELESAAIDQSQFFSHFNKNTGGQ